jgi:ParB family chromosome partitioning protein
LRTADGSALTEEAITDPAHWAVWPDEEIGFVDRATGERVDEGCIDFATKDDPNAQAEEGLRHFSTVHETTVFVPEYYCIDPDGAGLQLDAFLKNTRPIVHGRNEIASGKGGEDAEERARHEAEAAQAAKRERRKVLALTKLGAAAASVRRDFVRKLLARKTHPRGRRASSPSAWHVTSSCSASTTATKPPPGCSASAMTPARAPASGNSWQA